MKSIKKNYIYTVCFQALTLITPLITTPYISRVLEPDGIGYYSFYNSICSYFVLGATLGTTSFGLREISFYQDNKYERSRVFWENVLLRCITSAISMAVWVVYMGHQQGQNKLLLAILSINILGITFDISWFFQGLEEFGKTISRSAFFRILNVVLILVFVKRKDDLAVYVFISVGLNLLSNLVLWSYLPKYIQKISVSRLNPFRNIKTAFSLFIPSIAIQVYTVLDKTMIGIFSEASFENGYYEQAIYLSKAVLALVNSMGTVLAPRMGYYYEKNNEEKLGFYLYQSYRFVWFLAMPLSLGLMGIAPNLVPWFYGENYRDMIPILCISSLLILIIGMNSVTGSQYLIPTKQQKDYTYTVLAGALSNFIINLLLIPRYFALGAVCASVAAEALIALIQFIIIREKISIRKIFSYSKNYIIASISMFIVILFEGRYLLPSWVSTLLLVFSGGMIYLVVLIILKDRFLIDNIKKIGQRYHLHY